MFLCFRCGFTLAGATLGGSGKFIEGAVFDQAALPASSAAATMIPIVPLPEETIEISMRVAEINWHSYWQSPILLPACISVMVMFFPPMFMLITP